MYTGKNPSAVRSQKWLAQSLLQLMEEKPYQKISIKEITEWSDLSRQTFYQLFDSKEEIIEYHLDYLFQQYLEKIKSLKLSSVEELARLYFVFFKQNERFIQQLIQNNLVSLLDQKFKLYLNAVKEAIAPEQSIRFSNYATAFISSGLVGLLVYYNEDRSLTIDQLSTLVSNLLTNDYLCLNGR